MARVEDPSKRLGQVVMTILSKPSLDSYSRLKEITKIGAKKSLQQFVL